MDVIKIRGPGFEALQPLLSDWSLTDGEGMQADRLTLTFSGEQALTNLPPSGIEWQVHIDGEYRGVYQISSVTEHLHPIKLSLQLTPAKFSVADDTGFKEPRRRTYPPATVGDVVKAVMEPHGYEVRVSSELMSLPTDHLNQNEETDSAFIARLAEKYGALAKPVDHLYVFGHRGSLASLSGQPKPSVIVTPGDTQKGAAKIAHPSNDRFRGVKALWQTLETGEHGTEQIGRSPFYQIKEAFKHAKEAQQHAAAKLAECNRKGQTFSATIRGKPGLFAESVMVLEGFVSPYSKGEWLINTVTLSGDRTSYTIQIEASRPSS